MGATSRTGTGIGDSNGKQKPENHAGCGGKPDPVVPKPKVKRGCVTRYVGGGGKASIKVGGGTKLKVC